MVRPFHREMQPPAPPLSEQTADPRQDHPSGRTTSWAFSPISRRTERGCLPDRDRDRDRGRPRCIHLSRSDILSVSTAMRAALRLLPMRGILSSYLQLKEGTPVPRLHEGIEGKKRRADMRFDLDLALQTQASAIPTPLSPTWAGRGGAWRPNSATDSAAGHTASCRNMHRMRVLEVDQILRLLRLDAHARNP